MDTHVKYCIIHKRAASRSDENWFYPASAMDADIIVKGFQGSNQLRRFSKIVKYVKLYLLELLRRSDLYSESMIIFTFFDIRLQKKNLVAFSENFNIIYTFDASF